MTNTSKSKVLILYKFLPQYRLDFLNRLRIDLMNKGIELNLSYGKLKNENASKGDEVDLDWAKFVHNKVFKFNGIELYWQPCVKDICKHDLVIVEQANKLLINYLLIIMSRIGTIKLAFWGHGSNLQDEENSVRNQFKRLYSTQCNWWFAYTETVRSRVMALGFPPDRITVVNNAIDTISQAETYDMVGEDEVNRLRDSLKIGDGPTGIFCGGMYSDKRLDFLIESCYKIRQKIPNFEIIFVGSGPEKTRVERESRKHQWIHYVGTKFGQDKASYFKIADLLLMPGAVGLAILDSFSFQTPLVTTACHNHGPEISYLEDGVNGTMVNDSLEDFSDIIVRILLDRAYLARLKEGCRRDVTRYNLEDMVSNFSNGVQSALRLTKTAGLPL